MGGVGKTTLAQVIYNDPRIHQYFHLRLWIYIYEDFYCMKLTREIYRSITNEPCDEDVGFDYLQDTIRKELMKFKRTFMVFDDAWNEKHCQWDSLLVPFRSACIVNILLTTRNEKVADVMRTMNSFHLAMLSKDEGWELFQQHALCDDENLKKIGQKIVKKCDGLPLAIKLLGSHLRYERNEDKWMSILESELWELDQVGANEILLALRLNYQYMPIHLKPCFRYCSMFHKNETLDMNSVVWLWMAQDYIQPKIVGKTIEETGREYFDELLGRSLLQATKVKDSFKMHDLIYDLDVSISGNEFITMKLKGGYQNKSISNNIRHLAIHDQSINNEAPKGTLVYPFLSKHVALRSIFYYGQSFIDDFQFFDSMRLRALLIESFQDDSNFLNFLGSISSLKHLRYLFISIEHARNPHFKDVFSSLFNSSHSIHNLQLLDLFGCGRSIMLPKSIKSLINLRHLILPDGSIMPCGISKLTGLRTLKNVDVIDQSVECGELGEIEDLASLTGSCCIRGVYNAHDVEGLKKANINRKKHIWRLSIAWRYTMYYSVVCPFDVHLFIASTIRSEKQTFELTKAKLEALRPHNNLKEFGIYGYPGIQFPLWLGDPLYSKLQDITLQGCNEWDGSGRVLDKDLPCLRNISIIGCAKLKNIKIYQSSSLRRLFVKNALK
ncbi:hypothetical protein KFK09_000974 [Dendrobium nobile]|uniref:NB-ARC domain-containing protein n=1 Tax=Dendrobium nobile TaxID=94219 RepID=A0A8T3CFF1_DENNO|nr:hypothetical protein KFK09_000974 [Dendrobium nobile]